MNNELNFMELYDLVDYYFKDKGRIISVLTDEQEINCILYDSFIFKCGIEEPRNNFKGAIMINNKYAQITFFGESISLNNTREDIIKNFELVDKYCQLRLPDKYLEAFFKNKN
ncbi:hypothetical protein RCS94_11045 [Orbaceae bacterium ac157xtp]